MQANYDERYINEIKAMASEGMELRLLSARTLRSLDKSLVSARAPGMNSAAERTIMTLCVDSLAVSSHNSRALYSRDEGMIGVPRSAVTPGNIKGRIKS
ncbi:MAG: hypothetical protein ACQEV6_08315 [Pseudomonadota bacterium]